MKNIIKQLLKPLIPQKFKLLKGGYGMIRRRNPGFSKFEAIKKGKVICYDRSQNYIDDYVRQFSIITRKINIDSSFMYIYPYDSTTYRVLSRTSICSITLDFGKVLKTSIIDLRNQISVAKDPSFRKRELSILSSIEEMSQRITVHLRKNDSSRARTLTSFFPAMLYREPQSLDEALQKILFYDALFWQMEHHHIGLGRLDYILWEYYEHDIKQGIISENDAKEMLRNFILIIGKDTAAKSPALIGDTGQYILLGGIDVEGRNVDNSLTELFLEIMSELKVPDPKLILRINQNTSETVWKKAVRCITTGIGSPLLMDETPIMEKMVNFGYSSHDVWNVGVSACWEPLIIGKSFDQNNPFRSAVAIKPLNKILLSGREFNTFEQLITSYKQEYKKEIESVVKDIDFDCSPLFSLFFDDCINKECDFTAGGAVYAHHGAQVVSFPNTINALLNIKRLVYDERMFSLADCKKAIETNFEGMDDFRIILVSTGKKFGSTDDDVLVLTNDLISYTGEIAKHLKSNGNSIKIGFSSPYYIDESKFFAATLDGRKYGDPFAVHISPISSQIDISEILEFSSKLKYDDNCINGNVVDFILPSSYIKQPEKLVGILKSACSQGMFELQLNVMDKATLIDAKAHPEKYPNLVVRVWGFSAYFNDLPEEFKDNLIRRAEIYEVA